MLSSVKFYGNHTGNISVKVINTLTGEVYDTITVAAVAGEHVETVINKSYSANLEPLFLGFVYDSTGVTGYKTTTGIAGCSSCSSSAYHAVNKWIGVRAFKSPTGTNIEQDNITGTSDTGGLSVVYSVECDHENWK